MGKLKESSIIITVIHFLFHENKKRLMNQDTYKNMCLIKYASLEESLNAIVYMQNKEIGGRFLNKTKNLKIII